MSNDESLIINSIFAMIGSPYEKKVCFSSSMLMAL